MDKKKEVDEWLKIAGEDYNAAVFLKNMKPVPFEIICFHCQQSAEKYLKAFLVQQGILIIKTHNLDLIIKGCMGIDKRFVDIKMNCIRLSDYAVEVRYPYRSELNDKIMDIAIKDAGTIKNFVLEIIQNYTQNK